MYKLENMNLLDLLYNDPSLQGRIPEIKKAIEVVSADETLKSPGEQLSAAMKILDPKGHPQREAAAAKAAAEFQAELLKTKGGRRTQKRPTARRRVRRGSSKARTTRRK
jgi:hypothetical protein